METMTVTKLDKDFTVEILKGKPKHSDIKKLLKSDFNFIKGIYEVYILESYHKTASARILLTDGFIIIGTLDTGKGKNLIDDINSLAITAMRTKYNSGSYFIPDDMSFEQFKDSYADKVSATLPIISKELETKLKYIHSYIDNSMESYQFIAKIA
jgi:hypothetical protein